MSLWATAQAFSGVRISGASTCEWLIDFWCSSLGHLEVFAAQPVPEPLAPDRAPEIAELFGVQGEQLLHGREAFFVEALFGARADAGQVAEGELAQGFGENVEGEGHKTVGFFHVAGDFGEVATGGEADRAAQHCADALADGAL